MSRYSEEQIDWLMRAFEAVGFTAADLTKLGQNSAEALSFVRTSQFHARSPEVQLNQGKPSWVTSIAPEEINPVVKVDLNAPITYPPWVLKGKVMHPSLESLGLAEFDVSKLEKWLHPDQGLERVTGLVIYWQIQENSALTRCLSLRDLEELRKKGVPFFRKYFQQATVPAWKSVVQNNLGAIEVPTLSCNGRAEIYWRPVDKKFDASRPAFMFPR